MYYDINEETARRANDMMRMRDYREGSATASYCAMVDKAAEIAKEQKAKVDEKYHARIDALLALYAKRLAQNINRYNEIGSRCPSVLVSGAGNFPVRKKEKQNAAWEKNHEDYKRVEHILAKIKSTGTGGIRRDEDNALEKLRDKLLRAEDWQETMKAVNAYYRRNKSLVGCLSVTAETRNSLTERMEKKYWIHGKPFAPFELTNNGAEIRRLKARIAELERANAEEFPGWEFDGGRVEANNEECRLQIFFDGKPEVDVRAELKKNGFRWSPRAGAWQRMLTRNAYYAAKHMAATKVEG